MRAESLDRRGGYVLVCGQCGRRFRTAYRNQRYCCGWCENVAHRNESKRPVDVYLGTRSETGREINAMRAALAEGEVRLMRDGYKFEFGALDEPDAPKVQALKPLEEAAEVYGAWQQCDDYRDCRIAAFCDELRRDLIDECMDVVQAVVSLLDAEGFTQEDVDAAIGRCNERNRERGRL